MLFSVFAVLPKQNALVTGDWGHVAHSLSSGLIACDVCEEQQFLLVSPVGRNLSDTGQNSLKAGLKL